MVVEGTVPQLQLASAVLPNGTPVLFKGMTFPSCKATVNTIKDYALHHNKQVRVGSRGGKHRKLVCTSDGCPFVVQAYRRQSEADQSWYISSLNLTHSDACTSVGKPNARQLVQLASLKHALENTPKATVATLVSYLGEEIHGGYKVNQRTLYRAREALRGTLEDSQAQSFRRIPALLGEFTTLNSGSYTVHNVDDDGRFQRAFITCGVFLRAASKNQRVYGFECMQSKGVFTDVHLFLLGKDSNMQTLLVAAAVCPRASVDHLTWFFQCVLDAGIDIQSCPIIAATNSQLRAVEVELNLSFHVCTKHVIDHELSKMTGFNQHHHTLVWGLQSSETAEEYNNRLQWIATACGPEVAAYLSQIPYERWVVAGALYRKALYGWRSRDFSDHESNTQIESDDEVAHKLVQLNGKLPFEFLDGVMLIWVQQVYERSSLHTKWAKSGLRVTPGAQALYDREMKRIGEFTVARSSDSLAFVSPVSSAHNPMARQRVDLIADKCTCSFKEQYGAPCRHMIAVALFCGRMDDILSRFDPIYPMETYGSVYQKQAMELPLHSRLTESDGCLPPSKPSKRQRPRPPAPSTTATPEENLPPVLVPVQPASADVPEGSEQETSESDRPAQRQRTESTHRHRCSKCKLLGHNVRSCPQAQPE